MSALAGLGRTLLAEGRNHGARGLFLEGIAMVEQLDPPNGPALVVLLQLLASTMNLVDEQPAARAHLERARELALRLYGPDNRVIAQLENSIGATYMTLPESAAATNHFLRAIAISERSLGPDAIDTLYARANLGAMLVRQERFAEATLQLETAFTGLSRVLGPEHPTLCAPLIVATLAYAGADNGPVGDEDPRAVHRDPHRPRPDRSDARARAGRRDVGRWPGSPPRPHPGAAGTRRTGTRTHRGGLAGLRPHLAAHPPRVSLSCGRA